jgi:hypothetical protein
MSNYAVSHKDFRPTPLVGGITYTVDENLLSLYDLDVSLTVPITGWTAHITGTSNQLIADNPGYDQPQTLQEVPFHIHYEGVQVWTGTIWLPVLGAIPQTNVRLSEIMDILGETSGSIEDLCKSVHINANSPYKPNGSAPYNFGSFRGYCHQYAVPAPVQYQAIHVSFSCIDSWYAGNLELYLNGMHINSLSASSAVGQSWGFFALPGDLLTWDIVATAKPNEAATANLSVVLTASSGYSDYSDKVLNAHMNNNATPWEIFVSYNNEQWLEGFINETLI